MFLEFKGKKKPEVSLFLSLIFLVALCIHMVKPLPYEICFWTSEDFSVEIISQFQNVTVHEGDITVQGNATLVIEDCEFNLTGKLTIKDTAEVIIRNAKFISNWNTSEVPETSGTNPWRTRHVTVEGQAKIIIQNSELILSAVYPWQTEYHSLILYDQATANITKSKVTYAENGKGDFIYTYNRSKLWIKDLTMSTFKPGTSSSYPKSGLLTQGQSEVEIQDSTLDAVYCSENSTVNSLNSNVEYWRTTHDNSRINLVGSTVLEFTINGLNSNIWLTNTTVERLVIPSNTKSEVWIYKSLVQEIHGENAGIFVVWDWPLFGRVVVPYVWTPYILPIAALVIVATGIAIILILRKRSRASHKETLLREEVIKEQ